MSAGEVGASPSVGKSSPRLPVVATLLRFSMDGVMLGAAAALVIALVTVPTAIIVIGVPIALLGAVVGVVGGLAAGLGVLVADRLVRSGHPRLRIVAIGVGGTIGATAILWALSSLASGSAPIVPIVGGVGAAIFAPLTVRSIQRRAGRPDVRAAALLLAAIPLGAAAILGALALIIPSNPWGRAGCDDFRNSLLPPQGTCINSGSAVEVVPRWIFAVICAVAVIAVVLIALGVLRWARSPETNDAVTPVLSSLAGVALLGLAIIMVIGVVQPVATASPAPPSPSHTAAPPPDPDAEPSPEPVDPDPGATLPPAPPLSTAFTPDALAAAMQQLADDSIAVAGPIDDPDIPLGTQTYPVVRESCQGTEVRVTFDVWFATGHNAAGLARIDDYWRSLGYSAETGAGNVVGAGRDPLPADRLKLEQTWDEDDLRLRLTSLCVVDAQ